MRTLKAINLAWVPYLPYMITYILQVWKVLSSTDIPSFPVFKHKTAVANSGFTSLRIPWRYKIKKTTTTTTTTTCSMGSGIF